jgi:hypothetical protein
MKEPIVLIPEVFPIPALRGPSIILIYACQKNGMMALIESMNSTNPLHSTLPDTALY